MDERPLKADSGTGGYAVRAQKRSVGNYGPGWR